MRHIQSLGILLAVARSAAAGQGQSLELLRKESLEGERRLLALLLFEYKSLLTNQIVVSDASCMKLEAAGKRKPGR
jgi:hypothetical protein